MKKAQIEIVGLVVIVIILTVGLLIAVSFFVRPKTNTLEDQRQAIRAEAVMNAILQSNYDFFPGSKKIWEELRDDPTRGDLDYILNTIFKNKVFYLNIYREGDTMPIRTIKSTGMPDPSSCGINQVSANGLISPAPLTIGGRALSYKLVICTNQF